MRPVRPPGVIRRHPDIKLLRRDSDIAVLVAQQGALLTSTLAAAAAGRVRLLYATCSVLRQENERVIMAFLAAQPTPASGQSRVLGAALTARSANLPGESAWTVSITPAWPSVPRFAGAMPMLAGTLDDFCRPSAGWLLLGVADLRGLGGRF
jgi:16S rRNA C967 or C1407 C5-methylase (RsmB/RsmF family)